MNDQKLVLDLSDLAVESIEVVPAGSLDSAFYGHGVRLSLSATSRRTQLVGHVRTSFSGITSCLAALTVPDQPHGR